MGAYWIGCGYKLEGERIELDEHGCTKGSCCCSKCGDWLTGSDEYPTRGRYCPNCGEKMNEEECK